MTPDTPPSKPPSDIALQAERHLHEVLACIGNEGAHYLRCFRTAAGRQLALNRVNAGIDVWTEPVWEQAAPASQAMRKQRYAAAARRISTLQANAPRLCTGHAADYWRFPTLGDLDAFIHWYKTQ